MQSRCQGPLPVGVSPTQRVLFKILRHVKGPASSCATAIRQYPTPGSHFQLATPRRSKDGHSNMYRTKGSIVLYVCGWVYGLVCCQCYGIGAGISVRSFVCLLVARLAFVCVCPVLSCPAFPNFPPFFPAPSPPSPCGIFQPNITASANVVVLWVVIILNFCFQLFFFLSFFFVLGFLPLPFACGRPFSFWAIAILVHFFAIQLLVLFYYVFLFFSADIFKITFCS